MTGQQSAAVRELVAERLRLLGQPMRIELLSRLREGAATVSELTEWVGGTQQNVSQHLGLLRQAGVVVRRKNGIRVWYELADDHVLRIIDNALESVTMKATQLSELVERAER